MAQVEHGTSIQRGSVIGMNKVKLIINKLNDAPGLFIDGQEVKGIVSIDYKYVTASDGLGTHRYTISYFDDLDKESFDNDPTIKTITVKKIHDDEQLIKAEGSE